MAGQILQGKTAILSGATRGLGEKVTMALAERGANICLLTHNLEDAMRIMDQTAEFAGKGLVVSSMVEDDAQVDEAFEKAYQRFGSIDIVFTNMGRMPVSPDYRRAPVAELTGSDWDDYMGSALKGVFNSTRVGLRYMRNQVGGGTIINTALYGTRPQRSLALYSVSRAAILSLSETVNLEMEAADQPVSSYTVTCEHDVDAHEQEVVGRVVDLVSAGVPREYPSVSQVG